MFATAAAVPPELFDNILNHFTRSASRVSTPEQRAKAKRDLSKCSLTCKFWASRCRPRMFEVITLRSLDDVSTLFSFPAMIRLYITDLFLEDTEPGIPWTHIIFARVRAGEFLPDVRLSHKLDGACTSTSVQTLRSIHPSLPRRTPNLIEDTFPIHIHNYRLKEFHDLTQLVRKLWSVSGWQLLFCNVSWVKQPDRVPPALSTKNRATCDHLEIRECEERWPFIWLCLSTRQPDLNGRGRQPYVVADEAFAIASMVRCITAPAGHKGRPSCANTNYHRADVKPRNLFQFNLQILCRENFMCTPIVKFTFREGRLLAIRLEFNTDPSAGCIPLDFDWKEFDSFAAQCRALTAVTMAVDEDEGYATKFYTDISAQMKYIHESGRLQVLYWPEGSKKWETWVPDTNREEQIPQ